MTTSPPTEQTPLVIPDELQARRRPLRLRPVEGPPARRSRASPSRRGAAVMGTSHRQKPVKSLVGEIRAGLRELFARPTATRSRSATAARPPSGTPPRSG